MEMTRSTLQVGALCVALLGTISQATAAPISYADHAFNLADYTSLSYQEVPVLTAFAQTASGNPGTAVETTFTTDQAVNVVAGLFRADFSYNPLVSGALGAISVSLDRYYRPVRDQVAQDVANFTLRTFIVQGGQYFQSVQTFAGLPAANADEYVTLATSGLVAADFGAYDFASGALNMSANPDFAQAMSFGFGMRALDTFAGRKEGTLRADNWFLTLQPVPEPTTLALLGLGLGLGMMRRVAGRQRRQRA